MRAGANKAASIYQPHITSYDYDCPVGEAGGYGQPGIGGPSKFEVRRHCLLHVTERYRPAAAWATRSVERCEVLQPTRFSCSWYPGGWHHSTCACGNAAATCASPGTSAHINLCSDQSIAHL